jgi:hypothetical protein
MVVILAIEMLLGFFLALKWIREAIEGQSGPIIYLWAGLAMMLVGVVGTIRLKSGLLSGRRLVLGTQCLQIQEGWDDRRVVKLQIPFTVFETIEWNNILFGIGTIRIVLSDPNASGIYVPDTNPEAEYKRCGYHVTLYGQYNRPGAKIVAKIQRAIDRAQDEPEEGDD